MIYSQPNWFWNPNISGGSVAKLELVSQHIIDIAAGCPEPVNDCNGFTLTRMHWQTCLVQTYSAFNLDLVILCCLGIKAMTLALLLPGITSWAKRTLRKRRHIKQFCLSVKPQATKAKQDESNWEPQMPDLFQPKSSTLIFTEMESSNQMFTSVFLECVLASGTDTHYQPAGKIIHNNHGNKQDTKVRNGKKGHVFFRGRPK